LASVAAQDYTIHSRLGKGLSTPLSVEQALDETKEYQDLLLLAQPVT